jgi:hypothetical protein
MRDDRWSSSRSHAARTCARPNCAAPAQATLTFRYAEREASILALTGIAVPEAYDLCSLHADKTRPPYGWQLRDERAEGIPVPATQIMTSAASRPDRASDW